MCNQTNTPMPTVVPDCVDFQDLETHNRTSIPERLMVHKPTAEELQKENEIFLEHIDSAFNVVPDFLIDDIQGGFQKIHHVDPAVSEIYFLHDFPNLDPSKHPQKAGRIIFETKTPSEKPLLEIYCYAAGLPEGNDLMFIVRGKILPLKILNQGNQESISGLRLLQRAIDEFVEFWFDGRGLAEQLMIFSLEAEASSRDYKSAIVTFHECENTAIHDQKVYVYRVRP